MLNLVVYIKKDTFRIVYSTRFEKHLRLARNELRSIAVVQVLLFSKNTERVKKLILAFTLYCIKSVG
jgi:hypothetical protein